MKQFHRFLAQWAHMAYRCGIFIASTPFNREIDKLVEIHYFHISRISRICDSSIWRNILPSYRHALFLNEAETHTMVKLILAFIYFIAKEGHSHSQATLLLHLNYHACLLKATLTISWNGSKFRGYLPLLMRNRSSFELTERNVGNILNEASSLGTERIREWHE